MTQPTSSDVHVDAALTNLSVAHIQNAANFVAHRIFPVVPVEFKTNKYYNFDKQDWYRDDAVTKRAPNEESSGSGYGVSTDTYSADVWATHVDIDDQIRANADPGQDPEMVANRIVTNRMLIRRERLWTTEHFVAGNWANDVVGATDFAQWSNYGSSDPQADIDLGRETILQNTGQEANTLVVNFQTHNVLKKHPLVLERYKYTSSESITAQMIARFLEIENYWVMKSIYSPTKEEETPEVYSFIAGKHALLAYVNPNPTLMEPSAGYTMAWRGLSRVSGLSENGAGIAISNINLRGSGKKVDRIEGEFAFDMKKVSSACGYFFQDAIA